MKHWIVLLVVVSGCRCGPPLACPQPAPFHVPVDGGIPPGVFDGGDAEAIYEFCAQVCPEFAQGTCEELQGSPGVIECRPKNFCL